MKTLAITLAWILNSVALALGAEIPMAPAVSAPVAPSVVVAPAPAGNDTAAKPRIELPHKADGARARVCFNAAETRETITTHRLAEPFRALRAGRLQGEALRAKLCRWKSDEFVYEVSVLRPNGHIAHVYMNARNGQSVGAATIPIATEERPVRLLVVEDDADLNRQIVRALEDAGYVVDRAFDGEEGAFLGETEPYDAVVLDLGLPKKDGITMIGEWRKAGRTMPILILTARDRWSDKVKGFDAGADDYVAKPFHMEEVLARLRALLRRATGHATAEFVCGPVQLDTRASRVSVDGNPVKLTSHEYRLLSYLMHHAGRVVSRSEIVDHLYDQDFDRDSNTIEVFVGRLRRKLGVDIIQTMRGLGYLVNAETGAEASPKKAVAPAGR